MQNISISNDKSDIIFWKEVKCSSLQSVEINNLVFLETWNDYNIYFDRVWL